MCLLIPLSHVGWVGLSQGLLSCTPLSYVSTHPIVPCRMGRTVPRTPIMYTPILCVYSSHCPTYVGWVGLSQGLLSCTPLSYVSTHPIVPHRMGRTVPRTTPLSYVSTHPIVPHRMGRTVPRTTPLSYVSTHPIVPHRMGRTVPRTPIMYIPILCVYLPHRMCRTMPSTPLCTIMYTSQSIVPRRMSRTVPRTPLCTIMSYVSTCISSHCPTQDG